MQLQRLTNAFCDFNFMTVSVMSAKAKLHITKNNVSVLPSNHPAEG